jgi:hypothetical protein
MRTFGRGPDRSSPNYVRALAEKGDLRGLARALEDPEARIRNEAAHELGLAAMAVLDPQLFAVSRPAVLGILRSLGVDRGRADPERLRRWRGVLTEPLVAMLNEEAQMARQHAAEAARAFCDERAVEPLIDLLGDSAISPLLAIRLIAAEALGALGDARAVEPLAREVWNPDNQGSNLRELAGKALEYLGETATDADAVVAALLACFPEGRAGRVHAETALRRLGTPQAREHLAAMEAKVQALREQQEAARRAVPSPEQQEAAANSLERSEAEILAMTADGGPASINRVIERLLGDITQAAGLGDFSEGPVVTKAKEAARKAAGRYATDHRDSLLGGVDPRPFADKLVRPAVAAYIRVLRDT